MLFLIFADWDLVGVVEEDVGGHESGVGEEADTNKVFAIRLVFVLGHTIELADGGDAVENPRSVSMVGVM